MIHFGFGRYFEIDLITISSSKLNYYFPCFLVGGSQSHLSGFFCPFARKFWEGGRDL